MKVDLGGRVVFSMNSKSKCTYQSQEQKKKVGKLASILRLGVEPSLCAY